MHRLLLVAAVVTAAVTLAACKSDSAGSSDSATATVVSSGPTSAIGAGPTTAVQASPTTAPGPSPTPEPATIEVIGDEAFMAWTQQALELIETRAPEAYEEVLASIDTIESVPAGSGMYVEEKRYAVGDQTAYAPGYDEAGQLVWYAGTIVHDAHHSALFQDNKPYTGKDAEISCLTVQKAALELLSDDAFFTNYLQSLIDGADDPANQYWNQPNRHW